jgi:hypothetical protein
MKSFFECTKGDIKSYNPKDKTILPKEKGQTMIYKRLQRKLKIEQHKPQ